MTVSFATKLEWFVKETPVVEKICVDCFKVINVVKKTGCRQIRCPECQTIYTTNQQHEKYLRTRGDLIGEPSCDLAKEVIKRAVLDARSGDKEALEYLGSEDGAALLLGSCGLGRTKKMIDNPVRLGTNDKEEFLF